MTYFQIAEIRIQLHVGWILSKKYAKDSLDQTNENVKILRGKETTDQAK